MVWRWGPQGLWYPERCTTLEGRPATCPPAHPSGHQEGCAGLPCRQVKVGCPSSWFSRLILSMTFTSGPNSCVKQDSNTCPHLLPLVTPAWPLSMLTSSPPAPCTRCLHDQSLLHPCGPFPPPRGPPAPSPHAHVFPCCSQLEGARAPCGRDAPTYAWIQRHFAKQRDLQVLAHGLRTPCCWWEYLRLSLKGNVKGGGILSLCQNCMNGPHFKQTLNKKRLF